jgi:hypothetical protein
MEWHIMKIGINEARINPSANYKCCNVYKSDETVFDAQLSFHNKRPLSFNLSGSEE